MTVWWEVCPDCGGRDPDHWFCDTCGHQGGWEEDEITQARREAEDLEARSRAMTDALDERRADHMRWCKQRALAHLSRGDINNALASFASDVKKYPETADNTAITFLLATEGMRCAVNGDERGMRRLIEGFAE